MFPPGGNTRLNFLLLHFRPGARAPPPPPWRASNFLTGRLGREMVRELCASGTSVFIGGQVADCGLPLELG